MKDTQKALGSNEKNQKQIARWRKKKATSFLQTKMAYRIQSIKRLAGPWHSEHKLAEQRNEAFLLSIHPIGTHQRTWIKSTVHLTLVLVREEFLNSFPAACITCLKQSLSSSLPRRRASFLGLILERLLELKMSPYFQLWYFQSISGLTSLALSREISTWWV